MKGKPQNTPETQFTLQLTVLEMNEQSKIKNKKINHWCSLEGNAVSEVNIQYVIKTIISQSQDTMETETFPPIVKI